MDTIIPATRTTPEQEEQQALMLTRMKRLAGGLLLLMTIIFIVTRLFEASMPWLGYIRAFAEAAMVGALADWFAVTALFRHPLGIPIPHTAIIPRNKDRIGESLGTFVQSNFLSPEVLSEKIASWNIAGKISQWLADETNSTMLADKITGAVPDILNALKDEDVNHFIETNITSRIRAIEVAPLAGNILTTLTADNKHQELFDVALRMAAEMLDNNRQYIRDKIREESPWYVPEFVDNKVYEKIITKAEQTLMEVNADPQHELRRKFHRATQDFIEKLRTSSEYKERGEQLKEDLLNHPIVRQYFDRVWTDVKNRILDDVNDPNSSIRAQIQKTVAGFGRGLANDEAMRDKINMWIRESALTVISSRRAEIAALISDTVRRWDANTVTRKMELQVGKDLQYIRINGTVVGGLVGLLIHILSQLFL
jgi:uncharacterized membrane-anchored protein YjiN (DUF445 family)